jgi:hypothetical protein
MVVGTCGRRSEQLRRGAGCAVEDVIIFVGEPRVAGGGRVAGHGLVVFIINVNVRRFSQHVSELRERAVTSFG